MSPVNEEAYLSCAPVELFLYLSSSNIPPCGGTMLCITIPFNTILYISRTKSVKNLHSGKVR